MTDIYAARSHEYLTAGFTPLPLPYGRKETPPLDYTGHKGKPVSGPEVENWNESRSGYNICLKMQRDLIGIDVDNYDGKAGAASLASLEKTLGKLPPTWITTSRTDGISGIRLYRCNPDLEYKGVADPGIEIAQGHHRYVVVNPSIHPEGREYAWTDPFGGDTIPDKEKLPYLPFAWEDYLSKGAYDPNKKVAGEITDEQAKAWIAKTVTETCEKTAGIAGYYNDRLLSANKTGEARHDVALAATWCLAHMALQGHGGVDAAARDMQRTWNQIIGDSSRSSEYIELYRTAIAAVVDGTPADTCDCLEATKMEIQKVVRIQGAENRVAQIVAEEALAGLVRYSPGLGWLNWDGSRWEVDTAGGGDLARRVVLNYTDAKERDLRKLYTEEKEKLTQLARPITDRAPRNEQLTTKPSELVTKYATGDELTEYKKQEGKTNAVRDQAEIWHNCLNLAKVNAVLALCQSAEGVLTRIDQLDQHPELLNCLNGVVDLRTGKLGPSNPDLLFTKVAGAAYEPGLTSPRWEQALESLPPVERAWFQLRVGQALTGYTPDDDTIILSSGGGDNGKSTVFLGISRALGDWAGMISHRVLIPQQSHHPTEMMDLRGLRLALLEETPEEGRLDTHQLKMTVGTPKITARLIRQDSVTFNTTHSLFVNTNHLPQVDATDHGTWRRLKRLRWPYKYVKGVPLDDGDRIGDLSLRPYIERDEHVPAVILAWAVKGASLWFAQRDNPMPPPEAVETATANWKATTDVCFSFANDYLEADPNSFITASKMAEAFKAYLQGQGKAAWSTQKLNSRLPDSMAAAIGQRVSRQPDRTSKVREGDRESLPKNTPHWLSTGEYQAAMVGQSVRMWRGVRFKEATTP